MRGEAELRAAKHCDAHNRDPVLVLPHFYIKPIMTTANSKQMRSTGTTDAIAKESLWAENGITEMKARQHFLHNPVVQT